MNFSQDYNDEVYVLDNNPLYEDTTFIKIDIFDSISDQDHCETQYSDIYISNKNELTKIKRFQCNWTIIIICKNGYFHTSVCILIGRSQINSDVFPLPKASDTVVEPYNATLSVHQNSLLVWTKNELTKIVERKESKNKSASLKSRINNRITESLKRISKPWTSSNASDYESSQLISKQLIEFINVLTNEDEQPKQIFKQPKGLRIKCKVKGKNIRKLNDYYGTQACKASRSYLD